MPGISSSKSEPGVKAAWGIDLDEACETLRGLGYEVENQDDEWVITTPRTRYPLVRDSQGLILFAKVIGKHAAGILSRKRRPE